MLDNQFASFAGTGELILRITLGLEFLLHGWRKLKGVGGFTTFLRQLGGHGPMFFAWMFALLECAGAALLMVGLEARLVAFLLAVDRLVSIAVHRLRVGERSFASTPQDQRWELRFVLLGAAVAMTLIGPGRWSIDAAFGL